MTRRLIILCLAILTVPLTGRSQTADTFDELLAKVRHISTNYTGSSHQTDAASTIVLGKLCDSYPHRLTPRQSEEICRLVQPMIEQATDSHQRQQLMLALSRLGSITDTLDIQQRILDNYAKVPQEKIYVHTDKPYYIAGDSIWFRAHLVDGFTNIPVDRSKFVYVELHDQQADTLILRQMIKCDSDRVFANAIPLPRRLRSGCYILAAYTQWMRNFDAGHFFYKPIFISGEDATGLSNVSEQSKVSGNSTLSAPDSLSQERLEIGQRNGYLFIKPHLPRQTSCSCVISGSGNLMVIDQLTGKTLRIDTQSLKSGHICITLVENETCRVLAEQTTYINGNNEANVSLEGEIAPPSGEMSLKLNVTNNDGRPLSGTFSLSVTDADLVEPDTLQSDIVHSLGTNGSGLTIAKMLTPQNPTIRHSFETSQRITGSVRTTFKKHPKNMKLLLVEPQTGRKYTISLGDSSRFTLTHLDFMRGTPFILQAVRKNESEALVQLHVDSLTFPRLSIPRNFHVAVPPEKYIQQSEAQHEQEEKLREVMLDEVVKVSRKPYRYLNLAGIAPHRGFKVGDPRLTRAATMAQLLQQLGLRIDYPDGHARIRTNINAPLRVYIDNYAGWDDDYILNLMPTDVKSIEYFLPNHAENAIFGTLGWGTQPSGNGTGMVSGILFIYLNDGSEVRRAKVKAGDMPSVAVLHPLGYEPPVEFQNTRRHKGETDLRTTLYWNPKVRSGDTITIHPSDVSKRYLVTLEGVTDDGTIISKQAIIE